MRRRPVSEITLKDGSTSNDPRLNRIYELDWRSLNFPISQRRGVSIRRPRSYSWSCNTWLNQGSEGACVGFGFSHDLAARPSVVGSLSDSFARSLYWRVQRDDPWPGGEYPGATPRYGGTSVLTGAKVLTDLGYYLGYDWGLDASDVAGGIGYTGPAILGLDWWTGMFDADENGFIRPTGQVEGGHCIAAIGVRIVWKPNTLKRSWGDVDYDRSAICLHNSWGKDWGRMGRAWLTLTDLEVLMKAQGEACFPRRNPALRTTVPV